VIELADTSAWTKRQLDPAVDAAFAAAVAAGEIATCGPVRCQPMRAIAPLESF
jgi:hypothetical protein